MRQLHAVSTSDRMAISCHPKSQHNQLLQGDIYLPLVGTHRQHDGSFYWGFSRRRRQLHIAIHHIKRECVNRSVWSLCRCHACYLFLCFLSGPGPFIALDIPFLMLAQSSKKVLDRAHIIVASILGCTLLLLFCLLF